MEPELVNIKKAYLKTGLPLVSKDFLNIWDWRINEEYAPRTSRWLSWHMDFFDTKFRAWLWQFVLPHPSFSLTWLCSLIFSPLLLFYYLRLCRFSANIALTVVAFYLMTPTSLSGIFMLFRSAKILANFFILMTLVLVRLYEMYPQKKLYFVGFCLVSTLGLFSDETGFFIFPLLVLHPDFLFSKKGWLGILVVLLLAGIAYLGGIKTMCHYVSGTPLKGLEVSSYLHNFLNPAFAIDFIKNFNLNSETLLAQTMGIVIPHPKAPVLAKLLLLADVLSWGTILIMMSLNKKLLKPSAKKNISMAHIIPYGVLVS